MDYIDTKFFQKLHVPEWHFDPVVRHAEEEVRLDHLERLVGQRCAVDGDLASHRPGRVIQRVLPRGVGDALPRPGAKRAAARRDEQAAHVAARTRAEALEDRRVLTVDGDDLSATLRARGGRQLAGDHQRFLVRQRHPLSGGECGERRIESRGANDRIQHDVHVRAERRLDERALAEPGKGRLPLHRLRREQVRIHVRRERRDEEPLPVPGQHAQRRLADRSGRPENGDAASRHGAGISSHPSRA